MPLEFGIANIVIIVAIAIISIGYILLSNNSYIPPFHHPSDGSTPLTILHTPQNTIQQMNVDPELSNLPQNDTSTTTASTPLLRLIHKDVLASTVIHGPGMPQPRFTQYTNTGVLATLPQPPTNFVYTDLTAKRPVLNQLYKDAIDARWRPEDKQHFAQYDVTNAPRHPLPLSTMASNFHFQLFSRLESIYPVYRVAAANDKNRYSNVRPNEVYRVPLCNVVEQNGQQVNTCQGLPGDDYVNASLLLPEASLGDAVHQTYIAQQAPLPDTAVAVWEMIWQQHAELIVNLANFVEKGRIKAHPYWPLAQNYDHRTGDYVLSTPDGILNAKVDNIGAFGRYGNMYVELQNVEKLPDIATTVRTFAITNLKEQPRAAPRVVKMLHFHGWPDFGVPEIQRFDGFWHYYRQLRAQMVSPYSPVLVNCSAGVGRTATFVTIDTFVDYIQNTVAKKGGVQNAKIVNLLKIADIVAGYRMQRMLSVQQEEQYHFIFKYMQYWSRNNFTKA